ncbi:MAG: tRNA (adenosine(37)-N6)-dimethylallyltransferase MiaA [Patescibacteria group bacterium]|nr:tRNA (adenosine(37)-N6)-dimethylallyltransferase MiaA [Patescibacteria group bacterium]
MEKLIALGGQTGSGKTTLSIRLAKHFNCEIINADSRQVYKSLNIGTAKENIEKRFSDGTLSIHGIEHHLIDILEPEQPFDLRQYQKLAFDSINKILGQGKIPMLVGGTGLYIDSVVYNFNLFKQDLDSKHREEMRQKPLGELQDLLKALDLIRYDQMTESDQKNPHRLIRAIEKAGISETEVKKQEPKYDYLYLGISISPEILNDRINKRVDSMFKNGLIEENKALRESSLTTELGSMKSIGYQEFDKYFANEQSIEETKDLIKIHTRQYAKRQLTWFKKNSDVVWIKDFDEASKRVEKFLSNHS